MSPKIVQRDKKREYIAYSVLNFLNKHSMQDFSIEAFTKFLGIGKSSLYHYYESKEEILCEAFILISLEYIEECMQSIEDKSLSFKDKLEVLYGFYLIDNESNLWFRQIYIEYLKIFANENSNIVSSNKLKLYKMYKEMYVKTFEDEIKKGTIKPEAINLINNMMTTADGMLIYSNSFSNFNLKEELRIYIDTLTDLIEK